MFDEMFQQNASKFALLLENKKQHSLSTLLSIIDQDIH